MSNRLSEIKRNIKNYRRELENEHPEIYKNLADVPKVENGSEGKNILKNYNSTIGRLLRTHPRKRYLKI